jgi:hypothetical protein
MVNGRITRRDTDDSSIIVFPCMSKYESSKKQPYTSYMDRLLAFLRAEDGILITCGYSFGDQHINDIILTGLDRTNTSHVIALFYDEISEDAAVVKLAKKQSRLSVYGRKRAVIAGNLGDWSLKPGIKLDEGLLSLYYSTADSKNPKTASEFLLPEFSQFVQFLAHLNYRHSGLQDGRKTI